MEIAMVAIKPVLKKLGDLLVGEFTLEKRVRKGMESLVTELTLMHAALHKVAKVPHEQLDEGVKIWAGHVRELSYHMEDIIDAFMVRVEDGGEPANPKNKVKKLLEKTIKLFKKGKDLHWISDALEEVVCQAKNLAELRQRYEQEVCHTGCGASVDPRVLALYTDATELVGIEETRDEVIDMLLEGDDWSEHLLKTVSIVGFGGLGKTTIAKAAYDKIKVQFDCDAFVSVSQKPDMKKVFKDILYELDRNKYACIHSAIRDERQLIDTLRDFLTNRRYLIIIDDIWDVKAWQLIKCAFSKESLGSRLITTTRIISVSEACCSSSVDIYIMKPLSHDASRRLFNKRIFSNEKGCPPELVQVSEDILQKCGGVPLAIITIAGLLASNRQIMVKEQWYVLLNCIGRGLTDNFSVGEMKKILLFSYYDLPSYLKPCLLYLSIFPEDKKILRSRLVWKWICEGLVYSEKQETSLYELGDRYFNELVNRSLIQPTGIFCRVHDMVLDLIRSLATEENFVTVLDVTQRKMPNTQRKVRRVSIQSSEADVDTTRMTYVRSLTVFSIDKGFQQLNILSFQVLRVLDLNGCHILDIENVGNLLHLRYLRLKNVRVGVRPLEIGNLQFLETLDLEETTIVNLAPSFVRLRCLKCLYVNASMQLPYGVGNMTSLEVLWGVGVGIDNSNEHLVEELGHLTTLRVLRFSWDNLDESLSEALVESLNNLHKLEVLDIWLNGYNIYVDLMREGWVPPLHLRRLSFMAIFCSFLTLPTWINPSSLHVLSYFEISLNEMTAEDIQILGMLPALCYLDIWGDRNPSVVDMVDISFVLTHDSFPCAIECGFSNIPAVPSMFPQGAATRLERLGFAFQATWISRADFDLSMGHLPSLEHVDVVLLVDGATDAEVQEAEAALTAAVADHPNHPNLEINGLTRI